MDTLINRPAKILDHRQSMVNMILFLIGQSISLFGSSIYSFAVGLYILKVTGSGLSFSLSMILSTVPRVVLGPFAGVMTDRWDRKRMMVVLDAMAALLLVTLFLAMSYWGAHVLFLYLASFLLSCIGCFYNVVTSASLPNITVDKHLMKINALNQSLSSVSSIAGPFLGGMCFMFLDIDRFFLINGMSFLFAAVLECFIVFQQSENHSVAKKVFKEMLEGIHYLYSKKWMLVFCGFVVFFNFLTILGLTIPVPFVVNTKWHFTSAQYGLLNMSFPVGMLVASLGLSFVNPPKKLFKWLMGCIMLYSFSIFSIGAVLSSYFFEWSNPTRLICLMVLYFIMAVASTGINIPMGYVLQSHVEDKMRGRVMGTIGTLSQAFTPMGALLAGVLLGVIPAYYLPIASGIIMLGITAMMTRTKEIRDI